jgi:hypothetical protein
MDLFELPPAANVVARPQPPPPCAPTLRAGSSADAASVLKKRKHTGTHVVFPGVSLTAVVVATPAKAATMVVPRARPKRGGNT